MEELGKITMCVLVALGTLLILFALFSLAELAWQSSACRDAGYPDAVHITDRGWFCIARGKELVLVPFEVATDENLPEWWHE